MKKFLVTAAILVAGLMISASGNPVFAQQNSIKLFSARLTFPTGPETSPAEAVPFASTSVVLNFAPGDTAVISSTPDGTGPIVIDNFLTINGGNACIGAAGQVFLNSCFGPVINPALPAGLPIQTVLTPIPPIDISALIPVGAKVVLFELRDFGVIAGNTDLFLVTTSTVTSLRNTVDFNNRASLSALCYLARGREVRGALGTFVVGRPSAASCPGNKIFNDAYFEDNMLFFNGVNPEDPELMPIPQPEYHLGFENCDSNDCSNFLTLAANAVNEPRVLSNHDRGAVIQLTYDPNLDGIPDPFNLISIDVLSGRLNIGVKSPGFGIGIYNNLTAGSRWELLGGFNLTRATLEVPFDEIISVDNIVFEPHVPGIPALLTSAESRTELEEQFPLFSLESRMELEKQSSPLSDIPPFLLTPSFHKFIHFSGLAPLPQIDIKPGSDSNSINPNSRGVIPVAIITTEGFDATSVNASSVKFGPNEASEIHKRSHIEDVNGDGHMDLMLHFKTEEIGVGCGDNSLTLTGHTFDGLEIIGSDFIETVGCKGKGR